MNDQLNSKTATLWVIAAVQFLTPFMFAAIGVALPAIGRDFSASAVQLGLIEMIYTLAVALCLLPIGRYADIHGRKKIFLTGALVMTLATLALALAPNVRILIFFRFFQGIGAAMITSTSVAILTSVYPREERGKALGVVVSFVYLGISAGPLLTGLMIEYLSWRWIFFAAVPVELAAFCYGLLRLKGEWAESQGESFDWQGSLLYMFFLFLLIIGTVEARNIAFAPALAGIGLCGLLAFLWFENRISFPILPIKLIVGNPIFLYSNVATWLNYTASFGIMFFFSLYLQIIHGISPKHTGFILVLQSILQAFFSPIAGRLADRYQPTIIATAGMIFCTLGLACASLIGKDTSLVMLYLVLILMGIGFGIFSTPNSTAIMGSVSPKEFAMASSLIATMRTTGMLSCMTLITVLLNIFLGQQQISPEIGPQFLKVMHTAMMIFTLMGCLGIACSIKRQPLASTDSIGN